ncbi:MAG: tRNA lysidine(34) synthetase TilS [Alphaproteobacteria bacterium]|nr:tRNA lysidine(34) synthetase TilS [Alphaproteobacteria bacterium]
MLTGADFDALLAPLGPFERRPALAVAVSGGPDSVALLDLSISWARPRGGGVLALTVDHGLRPGSDVEAAQVATLARRLGADHRVLTWRGGKPATGIQEAARIARYDLLGDACRKAGILHLLTAHHRDDQIETFLLRRDRGSGPDGLAGMAASAPTPWGRLLRPLLPVPKRDLIAYADACGLSYVTDPSNRDRRFTRVRLRLDRDAAEDPQTRDRIRAHGDRRAEADDDRAAELARLARILPDGGVALGLAGTMALAPSARERLLRFCLSRVGGAPYPPRADRLARLVAALGTAPPFSGRTLAGCLVALRLTAGSAEITLRRETPRQPGKRRDKATAPAAKFRVAPLWTRLT